MLTIVYDIFVCCRCTCVLPAPYISTVKYLSSQPSGPPKRPLNGYMRYVLQQQPMVSKQFPGKAATHSSLVGEKNKTKTTVIVIIPKILFLDFKSVDIIRKIAQQWRTMSPEQKQVFYASIS